MTLLCASSIVLMLALLLFGAKRLLRYLQFFQLEEYNSTRFLSWYCNEKAFDLRGSVFVLVGAALTFFVPCKICNALGIVVTALGLAYLAFSEEDPRHTGKVTLKMTERAKKIYFISFLIFLVGLLIVYIVFAHQLSLGILFYFALLFVQLPPLMLLIANQLLSPFELALQEKYKCEAMTKLKEIDPFVIGITGSYGKTSTKSILGQVLNVALAPTYWPQKGINTVMGITRDIRENLSRSHKYAVIEMGAYGIGSIKKLTDFTPPKAALVTAVGLMHLDRFGGAENIYAAKSELPAAVPTSGLVVLNGDNPGCRRMYEAFSSTRRCVLYGIEPRNGPLDYQASEPEYTLRGSQFTISHKGKSYSVTTPLLGRGAVSNCTGAFALAVEIGADPLYVAACLASLTPVDNRLVLDKTSKGTYLRDAYNSNPQGFAAALEVLQKLKGNKKILMTPGMIELGDKGPTENQRIAALASSMITNAVIVGAHNRDSLIKGFTEGGLRKEQMTIVDSRAEAFAYLNKTVEKDDLVLIENDLTDLHEGKVKF